MSKAVKVDKALIHWHGGKFRIADWIIGFFPDHKLYIEPFGGAASVLLRKTPAVTEIYNDIDNRLFRVFKTIREYPVQLSNALNNTLFSRKELEYCYKNLNNETINDVEFSRIFITISHLAISTTSINQNTGFRGSINSRDYCSQAGTFYSLPEIVSILRLRLKNVIIENNTYSKLIERYNKDKNSLWYFDPPYTPESRSESSNRRGYSHDMSIEQHEQLIDAILKIKGKVVISGYDSELYNSKLKDWHIETTRNMIDSRIKKTEILWMNFTPKKQLNMFEK